MMFDIVPCDRPPPELRELYFRTLLEPQVHYLEQRVAAARVFEVLGSGGAMEGYIAIHAGAVVEFFAVDALLPSLGEVFHAASVRGGATSAIVKSYDALALVATAERRAQVAILGVNCTTWSDERFDLPPGFAPRAGNARDRDFLLAIGPGLFETPDEIPRHLEAGGITICELDGEPAGCGVLTPVRSGADAFDIGVGVLPKRRRKGLGEHIVRYLKVHCLRELHVRPVCGCAVDNIASWRTLEKAGFLSRHRLLEFRWEPKGGVSRSD
jgi:RimJ/RimL family protein N-acetyltransferase